MEYPIKSKISHPKRKPSGKKKFKIKRQAERQRSFKEDVNTLSTNAVDNQVSKVSSIISEFDEAERLCLPNYNFLQTTSNRVDQNYPKYYNVDEYQNMETAVERRKYRHSKDLRNHLKGNTDDVPQHPEHRICFTQLRGRKCGDETCLFKHDFRLPRKLRLCSDWKNGFCALGEFCLHLHSEFPCRVHYLGLKTLKHDPKTCRYHHGGPLPKEYEDMFLKSIDLVRHPMSIEMYKSQLIQLKGAVTGHSTIAEPKSDVNRCGDEFTEKQEAVERDILPAENGINEVIGKSMEPLGKNVVNDSFDACEEKDAECE